MMVATVPLRLTVSACAAASPEARPRPFAAFDAKLSLFSASPAFSPPPTLLAESGAVYLSRMHPKI